MVQHWHGGTGVGALARWDTPSFQGRLVHAGSTVVAVQGSAGRVRSAFMARGVHTTHRRGEDLDADQLEMLAVAANLIGRDQDSIRAWERAHVDHLRAGRRDRAANSACWAALILLLRGEMAQAGGWMTRAERIVEELAPMSRSRPGGCC